MPGKFRIITLLALLVGALAYFAPIWYGRHVCQARVEYIESDVETLQEELNSPRTCIRSRAALDLQKLGAKGAPAVPRLVELLKDKAPSVRWRSAAALGHIGSWTDSSREAVYAAFDDDNETVRLNT